MSILLDFPRDPKYDRATQFAEQTRYEFISVEELKRRYPDVPYIYEDPDFQQSEIRGQQRLALIGFVATVLIAAIAVVGLVQHFKH